MAEESSQVNSPQPPPFLEVICKNTGKRSRFASGTKAGFALSLINNKLGAGEPLASYIEAVKEGEEPISFGPDAVLVNYGNGWTLQTVTEADFPGSWKREEVQLMQEQIHVLKSSDGQKPRERVLISKTSFIYIGKILIAFILMFVLGAIFTLALENLPRLLSYVNSLM